MSNYHSRLPIPVCRVLNALGEARIVGGAVRDMVLGHNPKDWDICTPHKTDVVIEKLNMFSPVSKPKITFNENSLKHGTVTVHLPEMSIEITTLRKDTETDGRHAKIEFVEDYQQDAARRDFTINAMSIDKNGDLHDYFGGIEDLHAKYLRFIGNTAERIDEDYLRIWRYFRFATKYNMTLYINDLNIIGKKSKNLQKISSERIWNEFKQILMTNEHSVFILYRTLTNMYNTEVFQNSKIPIDNELIKRFNNIMAFKTPETRAAFLCGSQEIDLLADNLKWSNEERERAKFVITRWKNDSYTFHKAFEEYVLDNAPVDWLNEIISYKEGITINGNFKPKFPLNGHDFLAKGYTGNDLRKEMQRLKFLWRDNAYNMSREELLLELPYKA